MEETDNTESSEREEDILDRTDMRYKFFKEEAIKRLISDLQMNFIPRPDAVCFCGKSIFFLPPDYLHYCTRCDKMWKLEAKAVELKGDEITAEMRQKIEDGEL